MLFFWKQPQYQSDLDQFFKKLIKENPTLSIKKESGFNRFWNQKPLDIDQYLRNKQSSLPHKANPYL